MITVYTATIFSRFHGECLGSVTAIDLVSFKGAFMLEYLSKFHCSTPKGFCIEFDDSYKEKDVSDLLANYNKFLLRVIPKDYETLQNIEHDLDKEFEQEGIIISDSNFKHISDKEFLEFMKENKIKFRKCYV